MNHINDITKRHSLSKTDTSDRYRNGLLENNDIFKIPSERTFFVFARKIEKVVTAVYLVTDVMETELPLTRSLRSESLELLNACYQLLTHKILEPGEVRKLLVRLEHLTSLISIGRIAHHVSEMNAEVLLVEMARITDAVALELVELSQKYSSYGQSRHDTQASLQPVLSHTIMDDTFFDETARNRKRQNDIKTTLTTLTNTVISNVGNKTIQNDIDKRQAVTKTTPDISTIKKQTHTIDTGSRKKDIINVLTSHNNATMQDVQKFVTGCSEKTLQREMVSLISAGLVRKEGDKRWATYHVV